MTDKAVTAIIFLTMILIFGMIFWIALTDGATFPESRTITLTSSHFNDGVIRKYWDIGDSQGRSYEISVDTLAASNIFPANNFNTSPDQTMEIGNNYSIVIWHSIFGGYTTDTTSDWDSNPSISYIKMS
jgi:hypothetical protein